MHKEEAEERSQEGSYQIFRRKVVQKGRGNKGGKSTYFPWKASNGMKGHGQQEKGQICVIASFSRINPQRQASGAREEESVEPSANC